jgi:hypothetical protein
MCSTRSTTTVAKGGVNKRNQLRMAEEEKKKVRITFYMSSLGSIKKNQSRSIGSAIITKDRVKETFLEKSLVVALLNAKTVNAGMYSGWNILEADDPASGSNNAISGDAKTGAIKSNEFLAEYHEIPITLSELDYSDLAATACMSAIILRGSLRAKALRHVSKSEIPSTVRLLDFLGMTTTMPLSYK